MRSVYEQRRENLRALMHTWGGPTSLAKKLGHSNGSYLACASLTIDLVFVLLALR